jgi:hypothetical protein
MSLEDDINKRIIAFEKQTSLATEKKRLEEEQKRLADEQKEANALIERDNLQRNLDAKIAVFKKDVPYAHKVIAQVDSLILPILTDFHNKLVGRFPIVKFEGGASYELQIPKIGQYVDLSRGFSYGDLRYRLVWGKMEYTRYERHPLFEDEQDWEKQDCASFGVSGLFSPKYFGSMSVGSKSYDIEQWIKDPHILVEDLKLGLKNTQIEKFNRQIDHGPPSYRPGEWG